MTRAQPQERQGQTDLVVLVALVAEHRPPDGKDLGDLLLGGRLGQRSGDTHDDRLEPVPPRAGRRHERSPGIGHSDDASHRRPAGPPRHRGSTSAAAPAATAASRNLWPSVRSPVNAKNASPGRTNRLSTAPPRIGSGPARTIRPPTAVASSMAVKLVGSVGRYDRCPSLTIRGIVAWGLGEPVTRRVRSDGRAGNTGAAPAPSRRGFPALVLRPWNPWTRGTSVARMTARATFRNSSYEVTFSLMPISSLGSGRA